jgi:LuxR family transcriptional regulator, quorum-sensing system regulator CinR
MESVSSAFTKLTDKILGYNSDPLAEILKSIASELGLAHIVHIRITRERSEDVAAMVSVNTFSKEWKARYFFKQYSQVDPVVTFGQQATAPFDWATLNRDDPAVENFFADAVRHGVGVNGLSIPVRSRKNSVSLVSFSSDLAGEEWEAFKASNLANLQQLSVLIESAESVDKKKLSRGPVELSQREEQCLVWAARGKTQQEIAKILDLTPGSVKTYLDSARRKLECKNLTHAVGVAVAAGIIPAELVGDGDMSQ